MFRKHSQKLKKAMLPVALAFNCTAVPLVKADDSASVAPPPATPVAADTTAIDSTAVRPPLVLAPTPDSTVVPVKEKLPFEGMWRMNQFNVVGRIERTENDRLRLTIADVDSTEGRPFLYFSHPSVRDSLDRVAVQKGVNRVERLVTKEQAVSIIGYSPNSDIKPLGNGKYGGKVDVRGKRMKVNLELTMADPDHINVKATAKVLFFKVSKRGTWIRVPEGTTPPRATPGADPLKELLDGP